MSTVEVDHARSAYDARRWDDAKAMFHLARDTAPLAIEDAERLAWCSIWTLAPVSECIGAFEDLETQALRDGEPVVAARATIEQIRMHAMMENQVLVAACYQRALEQAGDDEATRLLLEMYPALGATTAGDFQRARQISEDILPRAQALGDRTLEALATWQIGTGLVHVGEVERGIEKLDQSMLLATGPGVHPLYSGMLTCGVVMTCRGIGDWPRAKEWTEVADRHCSRNAVCHYPGHCSVFRSELLRLNGDLAGAAEEAITSLLLNGDWSRVWIGAAHHQRGEAELGRGNLVEAQEAFAQAIEVGYSPQPGQAQLHLLAGDGDAAFRSVRSAIEDPSVMAEADRIPTLVGGVEIASQMGELDAARSWVEVLEELRRRYRTAGAAAGAHQGAGILALATGDADTAVERVRQAVAEWAAAGSSLHSARARILLAEALECRGEEAEGALERQIATRALERFGARSDAAPGDAIQPSGTHVRRTLSFTDIVGSSELLAAMGDDAWSQVLAVHDDILRSALGDVGGLEVKHEGDGLFVAFEAESRAIDWAISVQRRLEAHRSTVGFVPQVRIGVHCGDALQYGDDFIGRCVHETARIANAAGAGQIFVSESTLENLDAPPPVAGRHELELKGFDRPHPVAEIAWAPSSP